MAPFRSPPQIHPSPRSPPSNPRLRCPQERLKQQKQQHEPSAAPSAPKLKEPASFATPQGRALYAALFNQPTARQRAAAVREMFLPRRLAFVYDFGDDEGEGSGGGGGSGGSELPTTLRRSQADCPPAQEVLPANADGALLGRVGRVAAYINANLMGKGGQRKPKKKEHADAIKALLMGTEAQVGARGLREGLGGLASSGGVRGLVGCLGGLGFQVCTCVPLAWITQGVTSTDSLESSGVLVHVSFCAV